MRRSKSKRIVLTGVSRGLGLAMAREFVRRGHTVIGCARSATETRKLKSELGTPNDFACLDVTVDTDVKTWADRVLKRHGAPDLLLNNAALMNRPARLWEIPPQEFSDVVDVNIKGVANVLRHFLPAMVREERGVIVNFSSGWGRSTDAQVAPYCATKWAIEGLTKALAQELPEGMAAIPLNPGIINTDMLQICFGASAASYPGADEWAKKAVPLLLKLSAKDNGQSLDVG